MIRRPLLITSFCFLIVGTASLVGSLHLPMGSADRPGAGVYPFLVAIFLIALSLRLLIPSLKGKEAQEEREEPFPQGKDLQRVVFLGLALTLFAILLRPLGYGIGSAVLMGATLRLLGMPSWKKIILISIVSAAISYYLFVYVLDVPLPRGILFS